MEPMTIKQKQTITKLKRGMKRWGVGSNLCSFGENWLQQAWLDNNTGTLRHDQQFVDTDKTTSVNNRDYFRFLHAQNPTVFFEKENNHLMRVWMSLIAFTLLYEGLWGMEIEVVIDIFSVNVLLAGTNAFILLLKTKVRKQPESEALVVQVSRSLWSFRKWNLMKSGKTNVHLFI